MNYIHRFGGRLLTIAANVHVLGYGAYSPSFTERRGSKLQSVQMDQFGEFREAYIGATLHVGYRCHHVHRHAVLLFPRNLAAPRIQCLLRLPYRCVHPLSRCSMSHGHV